MPSDLDEAALERWLRSETPITTLISVDRLSGGQSNPTYRLFTDRGDFVLRRKPFGPLLATAHAVDREFALVNALSPIGYPVPRPVAICTDPAVIGSIFYVMEFVEGRIFLDGNLPGLEPATRRMIYEAMIDALAALHTISAKAVGLQGFGREGNYFARQVDRWTRQYRASIPNSSPEMEQLIRSLESSVPEQRRSGIVHGDYRIDNLVFGVKAPGVAAVLDWELSTLGDPMADLTYFALNWVMPHGLRRSSIGGLDLAALGIPSLEEVLDRYAAATGISSMPPLNWYFAFNLFRGICIGEGIRKRVADGNAAGTDADTAVAGLPELISAATRFADRANALHDQPIMTEKACLGSI